MSLFVFRFGYESPADEDSNTIGGWDDESSQWIIIDAPNEAAAMSWGDEIAEQFVCALGAKQSWRSGNFARWVEPLAACPWATGKEVVAIGQIPDFSKWI